MWQVLGQTVLLLVLLAGSFCASASETALFALSRHDRRAFMASGSRFKRLAVTLMSRPQDVLLTVLIFNTAVNVAFFAVSYVTCARAVSWPSWLVAVFGVASPLVIVMGGEILPKGLALANAQRLAPLAAPFIEVLQVVTRPLRAVLGVLLVEPAVRMLSSPRPPEEVTTEDLQALVELSAEQGIISPREQHMLSEVVALPDVTVRSVMVPRVDMQTVNIADSAADVRRQFAATHFKKLLVAGRDLDDIRGVIHARDVYLFPDRPLRELIQPVRYVPEVIDLLQLIHHFRASRSQFAVVVDEYGGVSGLVTIEDVVEQIVGDLGDVDGPPTEPAVERVDSGTYLLSGSLSVRPWRGLMDIGPLVDEVETLGGAVVAALGRLPRPGDTVQFGHLAVTVERMAGRRVDRVRLRIGRVTDAPPYWEAGAAAETDKTS